MQFSYCPALTVFGLLALLAAPATAGGTHGAQWQATERVTDLPQPTLQTAAALVQLTSPARESGRFDSAIVARGQAAFQVSCTVCHDAERALEKRKSYADWLGTVRRMAAREGADIPAGDLVPIATYLASRNAPAADQQDAAMDAQAAVAEPPEAQTASFYATLSPVWRGGNDGNTIEKPGFFPDIWVGAQWQSAGPLSARVVTCTSCHNTSNRGMDLELVDAFVSLDLGQALCGARDPACDPLVSARLDAGRFVVPFGAFASLSHPGSSRTVTSPLMFNMGRRVGPTGPRQPVLPAPYADEGARLSASAVLLDDVSATFDVYAVNGLQQGGSSVFFFSRSYWDNNSDPAVGGRATIGNRSLRFGGSVMQGTLQPDDNPTQLYQLSGADVVVRYNDLLRFYFEYAIRTEDTFPDQESSAYGIALEGEMRLWDEPTVSLLVRYDTLEHRGVLGQSSQDRFTWGMNVVLPGGSLLLVNHEHWMFPDPTADVDLVGIRWTATF